MRIKDGRGQRKELIFLIIAAVLTIGLLSYFIWLVHNLVGKSEDVFGVGAKQVSVTGFNFDGYNKLMQKVSPSSTPVVIESAATSTPR